MNIVGKIIEIDTEKDNKKEYEMYMKQVSSHYIYCKKCQHLTKHERDKIKALKSLKYFNINISPEEIYNEYLKGFSIIDLGIKYNVNPNVFYKLFKRLNFKLRNGKEYAILAQEKREKTCLEKYGDVNVLGKNSPIFNKRNQTVIEKYGVDNVRKTKFVNDKITEICLKKYGKKRITNGEKISEKYKERKLNEEEWNEWISKLSNARKKYYENLSDERKEELRQQSIERYKNLSDNKKLERQNLGKKLWENYSEEEKRIRIEKLRKRIRNFSSINDRRRTSAFFK